MISKLLLLQLKVSSFLKREDGATAIEYAIIAGLVSVVIIAALKLLGGSLTEVFTAITDALSTAITPAP